MITYDVCAPATSKPRDQKYQQPSSEDVKVRCATQNIFLWGIFGEGSREGREGRMRGGWIYVLWCDYCQMR